MCECTCVNAVLFTYSRLELDKKNLTMLVWGLIWGKVNPRYPNSMLCWRVWVTTFWIEQRSAHAWIVVSTIFLPYDIFFWCRKISRSRTRVRISFVHIRTPLVVSQETFESWRNSPSFTILATRCAKRSRAESLPCGASRVQRIQPEAPVMELCTDDRDVMSEKFELYLGQRCQRTRQIRLRQSAETQSHHRYRDDWQAQSYRGMIYFETAYKQDIWFLFIFISFLYRISSRLSL